MKSGTTSLTIVGLLLAGLNSAQAATWDGPYLGVTAGGGRTGADFQTGPVSTGTYFATTSVPSINSTGAGSARDSGVTAGLTFGYNVQSGILVYGAEGDLDYLRNKVSRSNTGVYPCCAPSTYSLDQYAKIDGLMTLRGRTGLGFGSSLVYLTGGAAMTSLKTGYGFTDNYGLNAQSYSTQTKPKWGWILGMGYEYALPGNMSVKAEYLHADFGDVSQGGPMTANFGSSASFSQTTKVHTNIIRMGFNKKF
jgi:outer membrane immunogenic protein